MIQKQSPVTIVNYPNVSKQDKFTCICCRIKFESQELQRGHFKSEWHLYNIKRKICTLEPIDLDSFNEIQASAPAERRDDRDDDQQSCLSDFSILELSPKSSKLTKNIDIIDEDDWIRIDDNQFLDEDYDEDETVELLSRMIKSDTCLFCDKKSLSTEDNINHMNLMHGFFVPEEQYMIDMEGFMEYLGFKVGAGATCLWCNKQFSTLHGVRLHMINKDHCKILYDQERAIDEFKEYYDYSAQEIFQMKPITDLVIIKKRPERRSDGGRPFARSWSSSSGGSGESSKLVESKKNQPMMNSSRQAKSNKKFDSYRAKILLRAANANNKTMRSRFRHQNPI